MDRRFFLKTLGEACQMTGWRVHAWVLMGNHYHLSIETPEPNLVVGMKWLQNAYTRRFTHELTGLVPGRDYHVRVSARDPFGNVGTATATVTALP